MATPAVPAAAWKSAAAKAVEPPKALLMSTVQVPWVEKGLVPEMVPRLIRRVAAVMVAVSGIEEVSKETSALYWVSSEKSPTRREAVVLSVELPVPPTFGGLGRLEEPAVLGRHRIEGDRHRAAGRGVGAGQADARVGGVAVEQHVVGAGAGGRDGAGFGGGRPSEAQSRTVVVGWLPNLA